MQVVTLPPSYSEADRERRDFWMARLVEIDREAKARAQPILDALAEIESRYAPRVVFIPDEPTENVGTQENHVGTHEK
jgi:hypothetical protein